MYDNEVLRAIAVKKKETSKQSEDASLSKPQKVCTTGCLVS